MSKVYYHLTNMYSPIDLVDRNFLTVLADYRVGPPQGTQQKSAEDMQKEGIFGIYTTRKAIASPQVVKLTGFRVSALSDTQL